MKKNLKIKCISMFLVACPFQAVVSQMIEIEGKVQGDDDVENIHVINRTAKQFTITNTFGDFKIEAKLGDTLLFSSVQYQTKKLVIDKEILIKRTVKVTLKEKINELDEVVVGKILTGDLLSDVNNVDGKLPINFYDVGIKGYTGKIATQSERRLSQAGEFKPIMLLGLLGGSMPIDPILNGISGRTKMLKQRVALENKTELMQSIKGRLLKNFLASHPLQDDLVDDFFYFCADDENFMSCKDKTDLETFLFLEKKYNEYLNNLDEEQH